MPTGPAAYQYSSRLFCGQNNPDQRRHGARQAPPPSKGRGQERQGGQSFRARFPGFRPFRGPGGLRAGPARPAVAKSRPESPGGLNSTARGPKN